MQNKKLLHTIRFIQEACLLNGDPRSPTKCRPLNGSHQFAVNG
jgi:hypothetical protein